ncbi:hypothetical protein [Chamaesiphon polymorphus]|nr:hypothetical protein [Chamaesiphon polymorphus]
MALLFFVVWSLTDAPVIILDFELSSRFTIHRSIATALKRYEYE